MLIHLQHGHNSQQLHDNADGTFSIVNPETSAPYPGTLGMEKEKPYRCEVCGKRYKNLNGLKYHKSHSPPCNPEFQLLAGRALNFGGGVMQGQNINVAGAGLPGIGEELLWSAFSWKPLFPLVVIPHAKSTILNGLVTLHMI